MGYSDVGLSAVERFNKYVYKTDYCWFWVGFTDYAGRGQIRVDKTRVFAHRFSYQNFVGKIPNNMCVCHKCDNPSCVNPEHLFLGSIKDNNRDMIAKGRHCPAYKLGPIEVRKIRAAYARGVTQKVLGKRYGVDRAYLSLVVNHKIWKAV